MNHGYIRVGAAMPELKVADCIFNTDQMIKCIDEAAAKGIQILTFSELCISAYTCGDLFYQQLLIEQAKEQVLKLAEYSEKLDMLLVVGMPLKTDNRLFDCAMVLQKGKILGAVPKTLCDDRHFTSSSHALSKEITIGTQHLPFGTDLLFEAEGYPDLCIGIEFGNELYTPIPPSSSHCLNGASLILNLSASSETAGKSELRKAMVEQQSIRCTAAYVLAASGKGESTTDLVYSNQSLIIEHGEILAESESFASSPQLIYSEIDVERLANLRRQSAHLSDFTAFPFVSDIKYRKVSFELNSRSMSLSRLVHPHPFVPEGRDKRDNHCQQIFSIQVAGLAKRLLHTGSKKVMIAVSGGLDSTLALLVCAKTFDEIHMDRSGILGITMPGFGTTDRTYQNALSLMKSLGISMREISIREACLQHFKDIGHDPVVHDVTYENTQARERTQILMDIANKENGLVVGTGDLSELALGWATYNGDHMSMYNVNGGVPKTLVRHLVAWAADHRVFESSKNTLLDILDTPVSPELLPADAKGHIHQITEDIVGPYELHDFFLYHIVSFGFTPGKIAFMAEKAFEGSYSREEILRWLKVFFRRFFSQQFKRSCLPDGPKVGPISLSPRGAWQMPSDASSRMWLDELGSLK